MGRDFHSLRFYKKSNLWSGLYGEMLHSTKKLLILLDHLGRRKDIPTFL